MAGKKKATKKFVKSKLKGVLEKRRNDKKKRGSFTKPKKNTNKDAKSSDSRPQKKEDLRSMNDGDDEIDFESVFNKRGEQQLASLSEKEKGYLEESDDEEQGDFVLAESDEEQEDELKSDSDEVTDENEEEDETSSNTNKSLAEEVEAHKRELETLKAKDPEFYKYLAQNDKRLLEFGEDDEFDDLDLENDDFDEEEDEAESEDGKPKEEEDEDDANDDEDNLGVTSGGKSSKTVITAAMLDAWERLALEERHYRAVWRLVMAFRTACHVSDGGERFRSKDRFSITSSKIFNRVMLFSLKHIPRLLDDLLGLSKHDSEEGEGTKAKKVPVRSNEWGKIKKAVSSFLQNLIHFVRQLANKEMIAFILQRSQALFHYFGAYPQVARRYLSVLFRFWTNEDADVRTLAYSNIRGLATSVPYPFIDSCLKGIYLTFVRNAKFVTSSNLPLVEFMCDSIVDLYGVDFMSSYQHVFVYIRQLAIHLRNSISVKTKDAYRKVYNWQFVNSVRVFSKLLSQYAGQPDLKHLTYPLLQIILGTIRLIPTSRYYPLRFLLIRLANDLAQANDIFVPVVPYILEVFDCSELHRRPKSAPGTTKLIQFNVSLKISKGLIGTRVFQDGVMDQVLELLLQHFASHAYSVSFPELIVPAIVQLKRFAKKCVIPPLRKQVLQLVDKLNANATFILGLRQRVDFSPKDIKSVATFAAAEKSKGKSPLESYYKQVAAGRKASERKRAEDDDSEQEVSDSDEEIEEDDEQNEDGESSSEEGGPKKQKGKKRKGAEKKKQKGQEQQAKKRKLSKQTAADGLGEDVVKEFSLSDDDE